MRLTRVSEATSEADLLNLFGKFPKPVDVEVRRHRHDTTVHLFFESAEDAERAHYTIDNLVVNASRLRVEWCQEHNPEWPDELRRREEASRSASPARSRHVHWPDGPVAEGSSPLPGQPIYGPMHAPSHPPSHPRSHPPSYPPAYGNDGAGDTGFWRSNSDSATSRHNELTLRWLAKIRATCHVYDRLWGSDEQPGHSAWLHDRQQWNGLVGQLEDAAEWLDRWSLANLERGVSPTTADKCDCDLAHVNHLLEEACRRCEGIMPEPDERGFQRWLSERDWRAPQLTWSQAVAMLPRLGEFAAACRAEAVMLDMEMKLKRGWFCDHE